MNRPVALLVGPKLHPLQFSRLGAAFALVHLPEAGPLELASQIIRRGAALVHLSATRARPALGLVAVARLCGARVAYQLHGCARPEGFVAKQVLRAADAIIESACEGIDCTPFLKYNRTPDPAAALKLVYCGPLSREQGLYEAVEALRLARFRGVSVRLVIAGGGPEEPRLRQRIRDLALGRDVAFTAPLEGDQKARLLSQADVLLLPAYGGELPRLLLEAMAAGTVPIATRSEPVSQVVDEGVHGHLVPAKDPESIAQAIARVAADRASLARMSDACRKRIAGAFSIERAAIELAQIYSVLCAVRTPKTVS